MHIVTLSHPGRDPDDAAADLSAIGFEIGEPREVTRTVLDTFDGRLHGEGLRLEASTSDSSYLLELTAPRSIPATAPIDELPRFADDLPRGPIRSRLAPVIEMRALIPLVTFSARMGAAILRDRAGKRIAVATLQESSGLGWSIDVHELTGHAKHANRVHDELRELGYVATSTDIIDAAFAIAGVDPAGFVSTPSVELDPQMPALDGVRLVLTNLLRSIHANWLGTIHDTDTEFLHEMRVAIRRSRSVLSESKGVIPQHVRDEFRDELRWLAGITGPTRDLDVYILEWSRYVSQLSAENVSSLGPVLEHLQEHRDRAHHELAVAMRSPRTRTMLSAWERALEPQPIDRDESPKGDEPIAEVVRTRLRRAQKTVINDGRLIGSDSPGEALHELRKDAKRLRYLIECFGDLLPAKPKKAFVRQLKDLQDNLGQHQDADVHAAELRRVADELSVERTTTTTLIALGQLTEQLELTKRACRAEFAERFDAYDSSETRETFAELLDALDQR